MSRFHSYVQSAITILDSYRGEEPFANFLKKYFSLHKKFGGTDRKQVSHLCYCFFRTAPISLNGAKVSEDHLMICLFLCSRGPNDILNALRPGWMDKVGYSIKEKIVFLNTQHATLNSHFSMHVLFPWRDELSAGIEFEKFCESFLTQPDLFIRIRPGHRQHVLKKLEVSGLKFEVVGEDAIALPNASKIESIVDLDREVVVQDYSSQQVGKLMEDVKRETEEVRRETTDVRGGSEIGNRGIGNQESSNLKPQTSNLKRSLWDCCAGSGGKSIMAKDILGDVELTVSDVRPAILSNLHKRFTAAGIANYQSLLVDLEKKTAQGAASNKMLSTVKSKQSIIIADVPCTGSGTWSRTPEQRFYFDKEEISAYSERQRKIVSNAIPFLQEGGYFLFITCSVFKKENEEVVEFIKQNFQLTLLRMEVLKGYSKKADTMFAALFLAGENPQHHQVSAGE